MSSVRWGFYPICQSYNLHKVDIMTDSDILSLAEECQPVILILCSVIGIFMWNISPLFMLYLIQICDIHEHDAWCTFSDRFYLTEVDGPTKIYFRVLKTSCLPKQRNKQNLIQNDGIMFPVVPLNSPIELTECFPWHIIFLFCLPTDSHLIQPIKILKIKTINESDIEYPWRRHGFESVFIHCISD